MWLSPTYESDQQVCVFKLCPLVSYLQTVSDPPLTREEGWRYSARVTGARRFVSGLSSCSEQVSETGAPSVGRDRSGSRSWSWSKDLTLVTWTNWITTSLFRVPVHLRYKRRIAFMIAAFSWRTICWVWICFQRPLKKFQCVYWGQS